MPAGYRVFANSVGFILNPLLTIVPLQYPTEILENPRFLVFTGSTEVEHWLKMDQFTQKFFWKALKFLGFFIIIIVVL